MRFLSLLFFMFSMPLFAEEKTPIEGQTYNYASQFVNMLLTLGFVLLLIFASVWLLKKLMRSRLQTLNRANAIKILERRPLNQKACLYLVDILGKGVVISESPAGIHVVTEFAEGVDVETLLEDQIQENAPSSTLTQTVTGTFKKLMRKNLGFGLSSSNSEGFTTQILGFSDEVNGQGPFTRQKSARDASKGPEDEGEKPKTQVNNA